MPKQKKPRVLSANRTAIYMIMGQAFILVTAVLVVAFIFFRQSAVEIYEELDRSITGAALHIADEEVMADLAKRSVEVYESIDDPLTLYNTDRKTYLSYFSDIQNSEEYQTLRAEINDMRRNTSSTCITYVVLFPGQDVGLYVFDASDYNVLDCGELFKVDTSGYAENPGMKFRGFITESMTYGLVRTDGVPCCTNPAEGIYSYLLSDIPISAVIRRSNAFILQNSIVATILGFIIMAGVTILLKKRFTDPLKDISTRALAFAEKRSDAAGNTHFFDDLDGGQIKEMRDLSDSLRTMESEMNEYITNLEKMTAEKTRMHAELELAESIQTNMLPNIFPAFPERDEFDIYATMDAAKEVGGDFYDFFLIDDDHLAMVIADVSGKGVPAALFMMMSKILVKNYTMTEPDPAEVLAKVNSTICQNNTDDMFVTIWLGILTISTGKVIAANAGHEYPILQKAGKPFELIKDKHGFVVGAYGGSKYTNYEFELHTGDMLFVYTDGLAEATNADNEMFGIDRILEVLNRTENGDVQEYFIEMGIEVNAFMQDAPQFDDLTMLGIKIIDIPERESDGKNPNEEE